MRSNNSNGSRAAWARGFAAFVAIMLAMGLGLVPAEAAPFAYVTTAPTCLGDRHGHEPPVGGGHGPGGDWPHCGRRHPGRETRLCHECVLP